MLGWTQIQDAHGSLGRSGPDPAALRDGKIKIRIYKAISGPGPDADRLIAQGASLANSAIGSRCGSSRW